MAAADNSNKTALLVNAWYNNSPWLYVLFPLSLIYWAVITVRRCLFKLRVFKASKVSVPVIVVGNVTAGGTGKSPVVISLVKYLLSQGYKPGVVSRGYGSKAPHYPYSVTADTDASCSGDEPLMIAKATGVPVVIASNRKAAADAVIQLHQCNVIIADDGLQHYALKRDIEIVVIDGKRKFGNGMLLPMGPMRESVKRIDSVDFCIYNNGKAPSDAGHYSMQLTPQPLINLVGDVGEINPHRFFNTLAAAGYQTINHPFDDHHAFQQSDLLFNDDLPVVMTEKDAVKVTKFAKNNYWYLPVVATISEEFYASIHQRLQKLNH